MGLLGNRIPNLGSLAPRSPRRNPGGGSVPPRTPLIQTFGKPEVAAPSGDRVRTLAAAGPIIAIALTDGLKAADFEGLSC